MEKSSKVFLQNRLELIKIPPYRDPKHGIMPDGLSIKSYILSCLHFPIHQGLILRKRIKKVNEWGNDSDGLIVV